MALIVAIIAVSFFVDEPLRRNIEAKMNRHLAGYSVRVPAARFQLFGFAVTLRDLEIRQKSNPEPAVLRVPRLRASVQWKELIFFRLVADFVFEKPNVYMNLPQLRVEMRKTVPLKQRGWQQAFQAIYPLKINLLRIDDGTLTYVDEDPRRPLRLARVNLKASNIRNIHSRKRVYPSTLHAEAVAFDSGRAVLDGHADFLAEPYPGIQVNFQLTDIPLDDVRPVAARSNLLVRGGRLSTSGETEYAPSVQRVHLTDLSIRGIHIDYVQTGSTAPAQGEGGKEAVAEAAKAGPTAPRTELRLDRFRLVDGNVGLVNRKRTPEYRVFVSGTDLELTGWSNQSADNPARATVRGKFMGSGSAEASATFHSGPKGQDFDVKVAIQDTPLTTMNDLFRAYGKFDVAAGVFSMFSEVKVKDQAVSGYVKPLFRDVKVYDSGQEAGKNVIQKLYERVVNVVAKLLENRQRKEVGTVVELQGRIDDPRSSTWQILGGLLENAFFKAILPGFERQAVRRTARAAK